MENMTALISCFAKAYHFKNYKYRIFSDPVSLKILSADEYETISKNMIEGIKFFNPNFEGTDEEALRYIVDNQLSPSVLGRSIYTEKMLDIHKKLGVQQYLIFASGYDTYAYRKNDITVFEIDKKEMIADKIQRLKSANIDYSKINYIKADFNNDWTDNLINSKYDKNKKTFCSLLGISYYLDENKFYNFLKNISSLLCEGSTIVFDYPSLIETEKEIINKKLAKEANEDMKSNYSLKTLELKLQEYSLFIYENITNKEIDQQYFEKYNLLNPNNKIKAPQGINYCLAVKK